MLHPNLLKTGLIRLYFSGEVQPDRTPSPLLTCKSSAASNVAARTLPKTNSPTSSARAKFKTLQLFRHPRVCLTVTVPSSLTLSLATVTSRALALCLTQPTLPRPVLLRRLTRDL